MASVAFLVKTTSSGDARTYEGGHLRPGFLVELGRFLSDLVNTPVDVGVRGLVIAVHRFDHGQRLLRRGRRVEVNETLAVDRALQDREVLFYPGDVERRSRASSPPCFVAFLFEPAGQFWAAAFDDPPVDEQVHPRPAPEGSRIRW